jgi:hypothetical protein
MLFSKRLLVLSLATLFTLVMIGCSDDDDDNNNDNGVLDPNTAPRASVDRFSDQAAHLYKRSANPGLPGANVAINMDDPAMPFKTQGLGPNGEVVQYYNFDVQSETPASFYKLRHEGDTVMVEGQLEILDVKPGDPYYTDFWHVIWVDVPANYVANTIHSVQQIIDGGYHTEETDEIENCPIVPEGSTAALRYGGGETDLMRGWYKNQIVYFWDFEEREIEIENGLVPEADIFVCFNINPDQPGGGPPSGFKTEPATVQTHNVVEILPTTDGYTPLWDVYPYDNADFDAVMNLTTAEAATPIAIDETLVNCPIVAIL